MIVAIDGPAGVGKSALAQYLARKWDLTYLNTGRFYRAVTLIGIEASLVPSQKGHQIKEELLVSLIKDQVWDFNDEEIMVCDRQFSHELHTQKIDEWVPLVSSLLRVRQVLNHLFRGFGVSNNLVAEGRDMTSEVFPHALLRFFLDASARVRAERRFKERSEGQSYDQIFQAIQERDAVDREKTVGALRITKGVIVIETSTLTMQEVCDKVNQFIKIL